jgi:formyl-CoA transferase
MASSKDATPHPKPVGNRPLEGVRVLDLTVALAGPFCTLMLAGLGAEVIRIEAPDGSDIARTNPPFIGRDGLKFSGQEAGDISTSLLNRSRSKKSVTIDLKTMEGKALFRELGRHADIVVENLSEGTADKLGVGYGEMRKVNPKIIYASIMGLGRPSAYPGMKTMDLIVQALSGVMEATGMPDGPPTRIGIPLGDLAAPLYALSGIMAALLHRERTGVGQRVSVSMLDSLVSLVAAEQFERLEQPGSSARTGNYYDRFAPFGIYPAKDGHVAICAPRNTWASKVFEAMGRQELTDDVRFVDRSARMRNSDELNALIGAWTRQHSKADIVQALFRERGVPCAEVRGPREALKDEHVRSRGSVTSLVNPNNGEEFSTGLGIPIVFSECATGLAASAPELGENNEEIFGGLLQIDRQRIEELKRKKVV